MTRAQARVSKAFIVARRYTPADTPLEARKTQAMTVPQPLHHAADAERFVARYWHRRALLMRGALAGFGGIFSWPELRALAARDDVESRLVVRDGARWTLTRGPFAARTWRGLPPRQWTLLIQGVNLHDRRADALMRRFAFLPYARLDDVMVSYATPGGGVGPHVDDYDVFLLQGRGRRRWRYGRQRDLSLAPRRPLKILRHFTPRRTDVLDAGDMLYLPPGVAHEGVALDTCTTYSIGFRAAGASELAQAFLDYLRDRVGLRGRYADAGLAATATPARIDVEMQARIAAMLAKIRVDHRVVDEFTGSFLSEPKPDVFFTPPSTPPTCAAFARGARKHGIALDPRTQLLYDDRRFYVNGMTLDARAGMRRALATLADRRALSGAQAAALDAATLAQLHAWHCDGYLEIAA